jgi:hypothetical protein
MISLRDNSKNGKGVFANVTIPERTIITKYPTTNEPIYLRMTELLFDVYAHTENNFDSGVKVTGSELGHYINDGMVSLKDYNLLTEFLKNLSIKIELDPNGTFEWINAWFELNIFLSLDKLFASVNCTFTEDGIVTIKKIKPNEELLTGYGFEYWWGKIKSIILYHGKIHFIRQLGNYLNNYWDSRFNKDDDAVRMMRNEMRHMITPRYPEKMDNKVSPYIFFIMMLAEMVFARHHKIALCLNICPKDTSPIGFGLRYTKFLDDDVPWIKTFTKRVKLWYDSSQPFPDPKITEHGIYRNEFAVQFLDDIVKEEFGDVWIECSNDENYREKWADQQLRPLFDF